MHATTLVLYEKVLHAHLTKRKIEREARFAGRLDLSPHQIYEQFYAESGYDEKDVIYLWDLIAHHLGLNARKLRPTDRFDSELSPVTGYELLDEIEDLTVFVRLEAEKRKTVFKPSELQSVDDVIRLLAR